MQDDSNRPGNDTDANDADIRPVYDEEPMAEVHLTSECNIFIIGQQHTEQPEIINEGRVDHESRNSSKNMPRFSSNDMVYNHYLDEARKKTQERDRSSKTSVMSSARFQSTADGSKPKRKSTNHSTRSLTVSKSSCITITVVPKADISMSSSTFFDSKHFVCSTCQKCVFNANHDACITKILKEVNSRAKIQSHKTRNRNKPVDQKSHTQKPGRQIFTRHRFSSNKTFTVYEKTSFRSDLRWKPMGRIFKSIGHRWIPTGKLFASCTSKDQEYSKEEIAETMVETMEQYMSKTQADYGSGVARPKIEHKDNFELKGQFLKELHSVIRIMKMRMNTLRKGAIPSKIVTDAKIAIQEMAEYSQKWHNGTSKSRSTKTSDGLAAIQAKLNNLGREIKKVNEKVYAAQVGCEQCKRPHYTKDYPLKEEGKTLEEAYYTQFGGPFQGRRYKAVALGFYQINNVNPSYQEQRKSMNDTLSKFMNESTKRRNENSNLIKEI
nr:hypothetical protein [Tanacetum cinerariifolium]